MSPVLQLFFELMVIIASAKVAGLLSSRLGQPAVLGEILAGLILGPSLIDLPGLPFMTDSHLPETIAQLAEIGVILLMFIAGLEVDLGQMARAGRVVILAGIAGVIVPLVMGFGMALPFGYQPVPALAIGLLLTATSVSISAQTLLELGVLQSKEGIALLGAAVVDDIVVILLLSVYLAVVGGTGDGVLALLLLVGRMLLYLSVFGLAGWFLLPPLLARINRLPISQGVLAASVVTVLFYAWAAEVVGHIALITGAFLAGLLAARSSTHRTILEGISSLTYGFFVPIFFVNIGLHADIGQLKGNMVWFALLLVLIAAVSKVIGSGLGAIAGGFKPREALRLGTGMISRGEVGLIVATLLSQHGLVSEGIVTVAVLLVLSTTVVTPPLLRLVFAGQRSLRA